MHSSWLIQATWEKSSELVPHVQGYVHDIRVLAYGKADSCTSQNHTLCMHSLQNCVCDVQSFATPTASTCHSCGQVYSGFVWHDLFLHQLTCELTQRPHKTFIKTFKNKFFRFVRARDDVCDGHGHGHYPCILPKAVLQGAYYVTMHDA